MDLETLGKDMDQLRHIQVGGKPAWKIKNQGQLHQSAILFGKP